MRDTLHHGRDRSRPLYCLAVVATIVLGLASRRFSQALPAALGKYPGDSLWALMVFFGIGAIFNRAATLYVAALALAFSVAIEVLKLSQAPWLVSLRHSTLGSLVFGSVFSARNIAAYAVGIFAGVLLEYRALRGQS